MKRLRGLFEEAADVVAPAPPRPPGWWVVPASYITSFLIMLGSYAAFGWIGPVVMIALAGCLQLGHKLGTSRWIGWDQ